MGTKRSGEDEVRSCLVIAQAHSRASRPELDAANQLVYVNARVRISGGICMSHGSWQHTCSCRTPGDQLYIKYAGFLIAYQLPTIHAVVPNPHTKQPTITAVIPEINSSSIHTPIVQTKFW